MARLDLGFLLLRDIHRRLERLHEPAALPLQRDEGGDLVRVLAERAVLELVDLVLARQVRANGIHRGHGLERVQRLQRLVLARHLRDEVVVGARRLVNRLALEAVELVAIALKVEHDEAVDQAHHTLDQEAHRRVVRGHPLLPGELLLGLRDVPQEDHGVLGVVDLAPHDDVADPTHLSVEDDPALQRKLSLQALELLCHVGAVVEVRDGLPVALDHVTVHEVVNELVPGAAPLEHRHERGLHLEDVEGVLLEVHVVLAEVRVGEGAVERGGALRLHLRLLALVDIPEDAGDTVDRAIDAARHLRDRAEPLVAGILRPQPILRDELGLARPVPDHITEQGHHPVLVLRVQEVRPRAQLVREVERVAVAERAAVLMAPAHVDDPVALVAVEVPQRGADRLVYQRKVLVLPGQVHRHDPDRLAQRVRRVLLA